LLWSTASVSKVYYLPSEQMHSSPSADRLELSIS
jgi:hypothetical protein